MVTQTRKLQLSNQNHSGAVAEGDEGAPAPSNTDIDDDDDDVFASDDTMTTPAAVAATKNEPESPSKVSQFMCVFINRK